MMEYASLLIRSMISIVLLYIVCTIDIQRIFLRTHTYEGIPPITQENIPLTADDIARGLSVLKQNPDASVYQDPIWWKEHLQSAYQQRKKFSALQEQHLLLSETLLQQSSALLTQP